MTQDAEVSEAELHAFVDGRLPARRQAEVLAGLGAHPEQLARAAAYAQQAAAVRRAVAALEPAEADPDTRRLQGALESALTRPHYALWLGRAAAVVLLLATGWAGNGLFRTYLEHRLPAVVMEATQAHHVFAEDRQRPVELNAAAHKEMVAWFSRHLDEPVMIPSLQAVGLRLVGGRLLTSDQGPVAQLIYEDGAGHRLTLCLSADPAEGTRELQTLELDGLTAGYWQDGEITYAVVAETSEQQLAAIATEIGAPEPDGVL